MLAYARIESEDTVITVAIQASLNLQAGECADNVRNVAIASFMILTAVPYPRACARGNRHYAQIEEPYSAVVPKATRICIE